MTSNKKSKLFRIIKNINDNQYNCMTGFVSQGRDRTGKDISFKWVDKNLINYINLKFSEVKLYTRDCTKIDEKTEELILPINVLINRFNRREIDYDYFFQEYSKLENNIILANQSEKYIVSCDDYKRHYKESSSSSIKGVGGMGKSHFLWECQKIIQTEKLYKHLFIYGKYFDDVYSIPWDEIIEYCNSKEFLFVIDGINEIIDCAKRIFLYEKIKSLRKTKYCRVFISYRTYSLPNKINGTDEEEYINQLLENSINFSGVEFDASIFEIASNFKVDISYFYQMLYSNNPMQIRMLIESNILSDKHLYDDLKNRPILSSTFIYEQFIKTACKRIWRDVDFKDYWNVLKRLSAIMFDSNKTYFEVTDVNFTNIDSNRFINNLKSGGYIDCINGKYFFVWEQLANYLLARSFFDLIKEKSVDEIVALYKKKIKKMPRLKQFLILVIAEKYRNNFDEFIVFYNKARIEIKNETFLELYIKNINDIKKLQQKLKSKNKLNLFMDFAGIPQRIYNCESYFFDYILKINPRRIIATHYFDRGTIIRKLKNNLYNLNGKYFLIDNASEFMKFAIICLYIPDEDINNLAEKTIFDLIELYDYGFVEITKIMSKRNISPLVKRSIENVLCNISINSSTKYKNILNNISKNKKNINAKVLMNFSKKMNSPYNYVTLNKENLYKKYITTISSLKKNFDEHSSLGGIIGEIRWNKLFLSLKIDYYHELKLNYKLMNIDKKNVLKFNGKLSKYVEKYNKCDCFIDIWDSMFNDVINELYEKENFEYSIVNQYDLFWGFVAHLKYVFDYFGVTDEELNKHKQNLYRTYNNLYSDAVDVITRIAVEEYIGSLMCNYFVDEKKISYWEDKIYLGFSPIEYSEEEINLCSPIQSFNSKIKFLDNLVIKRINKNYKKRKDSKWADSKRSALNNIKCILKPLKYENEEWVLLSCYINNHTYINGKVIDGMKNSHSIECIIVYAATNYNLNKKLTLDRYKTIEIKKYNESINDYHLVLNDFCKDVDTIKHNSNIFLNTNITLPPSSIINRLNLKFDYKQSAWINDKNEVVILNNIDTYQNYQDDIGATIYMKKTYYDMINDSLGIYFYVFTERLSYESHGYSDKSDMHIIFKNSKIIKHCMNNQLHDNNYKNYKSICKKCSIYKKYIKDIEKKKEYKMDPNKSDLVKYILCYSNLNE